MRSCGGERCSWQLIGFSLFAAWLGFSFRGHSPGSGGGRPIAEKKTGSGWGGTEDRIRDEGELGVCVSHQEACDFYLPESGTVSHSGHLKQK